LAKDRDGRCYHHSRTARHSLSNRIGREAGRSARDRCQPPQRDGMVPTAQFVTPSGKLTKRPPPAGPATLPRWRSSSTAVEMVEAGGYLNAPSIVDFRPRSESTGRRGAGGGPNGNTSHSSRYILLMASRKREEIEPGISHGKSQSIVSVTASVSQFNNIHSERHSKRRPPVTSSERHSQSSTVHTLT
jgi:hypothetical protein